MFDRLHSLKNKTFYDIGIVITAGKVDDSARFRRVFHPPGKPEDSRSCASKGSS
jgi:hypothetical protein